jgi:tRNA(Ile)-lysidine synthase
MKKPWSKLAHRLFREWKVQDGPRGFLWIGCSGGGDSVALVRLLLELRSALKIKIGLLHFHHGGDSEPRQAAKIFVKDFAKQHQLPLRNFKARRELKSEAEMRNFRRSVLKFISHQSSSPFAFLTAHHADDLLETRLIRLLRGTGAQGLQAQKEQSGIFFRPLLKISQKDLQAYLAELRQPWCQDPSNNDAHYLRNWVRHHWLESLRAQNPGLVLGLARSLELLALQFELQTPPIELVGREILRNDYALLTKGQQRQVLAQLFLRMKIKNYTQGQIFEAQKQLDILQNDHMFSLGGLDWSVNAKRILVKAQ